MIRDSGARSRPRPQPVPAADSPEARFDQFYARCFPRVSRSLAMLTGDSRAAKDATQEALVLAKRHWDNLISYDRPEAWVYRVAFRLLKRIQPARPEQPLDESVVDSAALVIADHADQIAEHDELHTAIRKLPARRGQILVLHELNGYSVQEVASALGIQESTVRSHLARAHKQLHRLLSGTSG